MSVSPHTYKGYNEKGETVCGIPAQNANIQINPEAIQSAVESAKELIESATSKLTSSISNLESDYSAAVQMEGIVGFNSVEELKSSINNASKISSTFDELVSAAQKKHDELQQQYNEQARATAAGCTGVTQVQEL